MTAACPGHILASTRSVSPAKGSPSHFVPLLLVHRAPVAGQPGSGLLPKPHSLDNEIQHTAKRLCDKCGRFKPVSKPFSSHVQTQTVEMLPPAPSQFLSKCAKMQL